MLLEGVFPIKGGKIRPFIQVRWVVFFIAALLFASTAQAVVKPGLGKGQSLNKKDSKKPLYLSNQIIVKFKDNVTECVECVVENKLSFQSVTSDKSNSLDILMKDYKVQKARPIFRKGILGAKKCAKITQVKQAKRSSFLKLKERLDQRKKRFVKKPKSSKTNFPDTSHIYVLDLVANTDIEQAVKKFAADPHVEFAQPNYLMEAYGFPQNLPNDTFVDPANIGQWKEGSWGQAEADLWGLKIIKANEAWPVTQGLDPNGNPVVVAVVDTGLDYNHPDIAGHVWQNTLEFPGDKDGKDGEGCPGVCDVDDDQDGLIDEDSLNCGSNGENSNGNACTYLNDLVGDDDENGFVDDLKGWDFTICNSFAQNGTCAQPKLPDNDPMDGQGHGTHVSGTIAAIGNNGQGIIGVAPEVRIMPLKGLNDQGQGSNEDLANAIIYAAENGADVINNSWGCGGACPYNFIAEYAVQAAHELGAVVVFAAGNSNMDVKSTSPQNMVNYKPIVVAASNPADGIACFSSYGLAVDVAAPGSGDLMCPPLSNSFRNILSLRAKNTGDPELTVGGAYLRQAGTSMSAPHVSGLAALVRALHPEFSNADVLQVIRISADDIAAVGFDVESGFGRINAERAVSVHSVPKIEITSPQPGELVDSTRGNLSIRGTITADNFQSYQLYYGSGRAPSQWTLINPTPIPVPVIDGELGVLSVADLADNYTIKAIVLTTNNQAFQSQLEFKVGVPNRAPVFDPLNPVYEVNEGETLFLTDVKVCDADKDKMIGLMSTTPALITQEPYQVCQYVCQVPFCYEVCDPCALWGATIVSSTGAGTYQLNFMVDDAHGHQVEAKAQLIVRNVNHNPSIDFVPGFPSPINEGELMTFDLVGKDQDLDDTLNMQIQGLPQGATFEPIAVGAGTLTYRFTWRPRFDQAGVYPVEFSLTDGQGGNMGGTLSLTVNNVNRPPVLQPIPAYLAQVGLKMTITLNASDPDGDSLIYNVSPFIFGSTFINGVFSWTPNALFEGKNIVLTFTAQDPDGAQASQTATILVLPARPEIVPVPEQFVSEGDLLEFSLSVKSPSVLVTYRVASLPIGVNFNNSSGLFNWTPNFNQAGDYSIVVTAVDSAGQISAPQTIVIHVLAKNQAPVLLVNVSADQVNENQMVTIRLLGSDPDDDALTYSPSNLPEGVIYDLAKQTYSWTPSYTQAGVYDLTFTVSDGNLNSTVTVRITVVNSNRPPVLLGILSQTVKEGQLLRFNVKASDPDGDALKYSASNLPSKAFFNSSTQVFSWEPGRRQAGTYYVTFTVSDGTISTSMIVKIIVKNNKW